jgi:hypothetical protein
VRELLIESHDLPPDPLERLLTDNGFEVRVTPIGKNRLLNLISASREPHQVLPPVTAGPLSVGGGLNMIAGTLLETSTGTKLDWPLCDGRFGADGRQFSGGSGSTVPAPGLIPSWVSVSWTD